MNLEQNEQIADKLLNVVTDILGSNVFNLNIQAQVKKAFLAALSDEDVIPTAQVEKPISTSQKTIIPPNKEKKDVPLGRVTTTISGNSGVVDR